MALTAAVEPIGRLPFGDLQRARHYGGLRAYAQSKKALALFTIELARRLQDDNVTANVVDPFLVRTDLTSDHDVPLLFKAARPAMIKPATAARWVARVATDPKPRRHHRPPLHARTPSPELARQPQPPQSNPTLGRHHRTPSHPHPQQRDENRA